MLLDDAPRNQLLRLLVAVFPEQPLRKAIFDFAGVRQRGVRIETHKLRKAIHSGDVTVGKRWFNSVLVPAPGLVIFRGAAVEESLKRRRPKFESELTGVAGNGSGTDLAGGIKGIPITGGAKSGGSRHAEPPSEMQRHGNPGRQFVAIDKVRSLNIFIAAEYYACKPIEPEVDGQAA